MPVEVGNELARKGKIAETARAVIEDIQPEAIYFTAEDGVRGGTMIVNMDDASELPRIAEPLFLSFNSSVEVYPCMLPEDLARASEDIEAAVEKFG